MRPDRSVIVSPSETKMKGVETRIAPPSTASGTPHSPIALGSAILSAPQPAVGIENAEAAVERLGEQDHDEQDAFQHQDCRVRQVEAPLQEAAGRLDAAQQEPDRDDRQRIVPG